ncbi:hypothetical protein [Bacillus pacificus]
MFFMFVKYLVKAVLITAIFALVGFIYGLVREIYDVVKGER